jgi:colanic acid biosynthesis glycosyl transferase WcaI
MTALVYVGKMSCKDITYSNIIDGYIYTSKEVSVIKFTNYLHYNMNDKRTLDNKRPAQLFDFSSIALLISIYFPPEPGGGAGAAWNRAVILRKIGYSVFVLSSFPSYPSGKVSDPKYEGKFFYIENLGPFTVIRLRVLPLEYSGYLKRFMIFSSFIFLALVYMPRILRITGRIGLVYSIAPIIFSSFIGFVYSKFTRSFFVYEVSDLWPEELVVFETHFTPLVMRVGKTLAKLSYMVPDMIVAISKLAAEHVSTKYKPKAHVYPLPIGVDLNKFPILSQDNSRAELMDKNILPNELRNKFIILYSGLISSGTEVENLAFAADKLKSEEDKEIVFLIVGEGEAKQNIERLKVERNLSNLYLLPFQPRDTMPTIISASDACAVALPYDPIYGVDVPTKFYEYLACGKPIIGVCGGEPADIINSNNIGRTAKPGDIDKLASIIKDLKNSPTLIHTMENNCKKTLQLFSLDTLACNFQDALRKEMKGKKDSPS